MKKKSLFLTLLFCAGLGLVPASAQYHSKVWDPDLGNGMYKNPVLFADYSDPDAIAVGDDYYLTASSFNCIPGLPILHSKDLVNWEIIGHALNRQQPDSLFSKPQHGKGVWAPAIRYHNGEYFIYWGDPDQGIMRVRARQPQGPWSEPECVIPGKGLIDSCPLWDDDGHCYLVNGWAGSRAGFNSVLTMWELSADGSHAISAPRIVYDGGQLNHTTEGPKLYKHDGWYWILCPAGGVEHGWQMAMRSRSPFGPYEARTVMHQGQTDINGPHQGAWVHTAQGEDWFLHFNDRNAYGRVVYLQPMAWKGGWPVIGNDKDGDGCGEPYATYRKPKSNSKTRVNPQESDEFNTGELGLQWQWQANYNPLWGMPTANGILRLYNADEQPGTGLWQAGNLLLQKLPAPRLTATTKVRISAKSDGQYAGVVVMGMNYQALVCRRQGNKFELLQINCKDADRQGKETEKVLTTLEPTEVDTIPYSPAIHEDIYLRISIDKGQARFAYSLDNKHYRAAGDTFTLRKGKWIGAKMGFASMRPGTTGNRGWMDVDWFRVERL